MIAVSRFSQDDADQADVATRARDVLEAFAGCAGYRRGWLGRAVDDPDAWVLVTEWQGVGPYRRALGRAEVRVRAGRLLAQAWNEPSAYEVLYAVGVDGIDVRASDRAEHDDRAPRGDVPDEQ